MSEVKKIIWYDVNSEPPKNYVWVKADGKAYEYNTNTKQWEESKNFSRGSIEMFSNMTEEEQMQVRKDLGLYYEETTTEEKSVQYAGQEYGAYHAYVKISDDTPAADAIVSVFDSNYLEREFQIGEEQTEFIIYVDASPIFVVVFDDDVPGFPTKGIYYQVSSIAPGGGTDWILVYNGETTVVSKVPERFLPDMPSGGLDPVTLLTVPTQPTSGIDAFMSAADFNRLANAETNVAKMADGTTFIVTVSKRTSYSTYLCFYGADGIEFYIQYINSSDRYNVYPHTMDIPNPVELYGMPSADMTTQVQLNAIGLTSDVMSRAVSGLVTGFLCNGFFSLSFATEGENGDYTIVFSDATNKYTIVSGISGASVTVTPLT